MWLLSHYNFVSCPRPYHVYKLFSIARLAAVFSFTATSALQSSTCAYRIALQLLAFTPDIHPSFVTSVDLSDFLTTIWVQEDKVLHPAGCGSSRGLCSHPSPYMGFPAADSPVEAGINFISKRNKLVFRFNTWSLFRSASLKVVNNGRPFASTLYAFNKVL